MAFGKRNKASTRDLGLSSNGKGDADRTSNVQLFRKRLGEIDWSASPPVDGFKQTGARRFVKRYGPSARPTIEHFLAYPTGILK